MPGLLIMKVRVFTLRIRSTVPSSPSAGVVPESSLTSNSRSPSVASVYWSFSTTMVAVPRVKVLGDRAPREPVAWYPRSVSLSEFVPVPTVRVAHQSCSDSFGSQGLSGAATVELLVTA